MNRAILAVTIVGLVLLAACDSGEHDRMFSENKVLSEENRRLGEENATLRESLAAHQQNSNAGQSAAAQATAALAEANERIAGLLARVDEADALRADLQANYDQALASLAEAHQQVDALQKRIDSIGGDATKAAADSKAEIERLRAQVADLTQKLNEAIEALNNPDRLQDLVPRPPR